MGILKFIKNILIFIMSYISFFQFLFGFTTVDSLITVTLIEGFSNSTVIGAGVMLLWFVCSFYIDYKEKKEEEIAGAVFHQMQHQFRDIVFELRKQNDEYSKCKDVPQHTIYYSQIRDKAEILCEEIVKFMYACFGKNFNVCIKMIDVSSTSRVTCSIRKLKIITLCRAGVDKVERSRYDATENILVSENSDFESILEKDGAKGSNNVFAVNNLVLYYYLRKLLGKEYKTSSKDFLKNYHSTIVVPIGIASNKLSTDFAFAPTNRYQVFGFLCIDYKRRISKRLMRNVLEYQKAFGDLLYIFFNEVLVGDTIISSKKNRVRP